MRISIAHTTADYDIACEAFKHGARQVTHLYNAMPPFSHRAPGVIGAAFDNDNVAVELMRTACMCIRRSFARPSGCLRTVLS